MTIYRLLKLNRKIKNHRLKFLALYLMHNFRMRYLAVNIDPVMACNMRCTMCYFTDPEFIKDFKGQLSADDLNRIGKVLFKRALKLQIGCGTEPTLYKNLPDIVRLGKYYKVPYISLTTNANLLDEEKIIALLDAGLDEFTISLHGVKKSTYETFMQKGDFEKFKSVYNLFCKLKEKRSFKLRMNYTFNVDNFYELKEFFNQFDGKGIDILQLRPIKQLGNPAYNNYDIEPLREDYSGVIGGLKASCKSNGITLLSPASIPLRNETNHSSVLFNYTFCYVSPDVVWRPDFKWKEQSFADFTSQIGWSQTLWKNIFKGKDKFDLSNEMLSYEIELN